jgi:hypothetical protein
VPELQGRRTKWYATCMSPRYLTTGEVAKVFFGHRPAWLYKILIELRPWSPLRSKGGHRWYTLEDVEKITIWLADTRRINGIDAERVMKMIDLTREGWESNHG